jgi:hypothetical protein
MTRRLAIVAVCAVLTVATPAVASASLVICVGTAERIVCACDSRAWLFDADRGPGVTAGTRLRYEDTHSKIDIAGRFIIGATGDSLAEQSGGLGVWLTWRALPPGQTETAAQYFMRLLRGLDAHMVPWPRPLAAAVGVFGFAPVPDGAVGTITCAPGGKPEIADGTRADRFPIIAVWGWEEFDWSGIKGRLKLRLAADPNEHDTAALLRAEILGAARQTDLVGGPIHIAVVDAQGARWIVR